MDCDEKARKSHNEMMPGNHTVYQSSGTVFVEPGKEERQDHMYDKDDIKHSVSAFLMEAGVPAHLKGYHYLREAIVMTVIDIDTINAVTKKLYPVIAKKYRTSSACVERAIRHAVQIAWFREDCGSALSAPGVAIGIFRDRPTNSRFIAEIAEKIRFDLFLRSADD